MTTMMPLTDQDSLFELELRVVLPDSKDENSLDSRTRFSDTTVSSVTVSAEIIGLATGGHTTPSMYNT